MEIINKEAKIETSDLGDGYKKAVVTVKFSPNTAKITDLMIGTVGVSTAFLGSVYLDNLTLSQYNAAGDYTEITETAGEAVLADTSSMPEEVTLSDVNASGSAKALYAYLKDWMLLTRYYSDIRMTQASMFQPETVSIRIQRT